MYYCPNFKTRFYQGNHVIVEILRNPTLWGTQEIFPEKILKPMNYLKPMAHRLWEKLTGLLLTVYLEDYESLFEIHEMIKMVTK